MPAGATLVAWDPQGAAPVRDWSSYNRTGTFLRAPTFANEGPTGSAVALTGGNYLTGGQTKLGYLREATLATEIKITAGTTYRRIWDWKTASGGDNDGLLVDLTPTGTLRVITSGQNITVTPALPTDRWISLVLTISSTGVLNVYVDGTRVGGGTFTAPGINGCAAGATLRLGADRDRRPGDHRIVRPCGDLHHGADPGAGRQLAVAGVRRAHRRGGTDRRPGAIGPRPHRRPGGELRHLRARRHRDLHIQPRRQRDLERGDRHPVGE